MPDPRPRRWLVALGSNLGDREACLRAAVDALERAGCDLVGASGLWATAAAGALPADLGDAAGDYLNAVVEVEATLAPAAMLELARTIEAGLGRDPEAPRNAARPIDVDLIAAEGLWLRSPALSLPHPRLAGRAFVLRPLAELDGVGRYGLGAVLGGDLEGRGRAERVAGPEWARGARAC